MTIRVLLVDDEPMVCAHLRTILDDEPGGEIAVVGEAHDGAEAVEEVVRHRPDVVLLDLRMPEVDGLAALEHMVALEPAPTVVVLTTFDVDSYVLRALGLGASGFLLKSTSPQDLRRLVVVAAGLGDVVAVEEAVAAGEPVGVAVGVTAGMGGGLAPRSTLTGRPTLPCSSIARTAT